MYLELRPSEIFYSQNSIDCLFRGCRLRKNIGSTLDDIYYGRTAISDIPKIWVAKHKGKWTTCDNRRLWVFLHLERLGKCERISVYERSSIPSFKLTSTNGGREIEVNGDPSGEVWKLPSVKHVSRPASPILDESTCAQDETSSIIGPPIPVEDTPQPSEDPFISTKDSSPSAEVPPVSSEKMSVSDEGSLATNTVVFCL